MSSGIARGCRKKPTMSADPVAEGSKARGSEASDSKTVKKDADGAFASSKADSRNNGALAIDPHGTEDPSGKARRQTQTPEQKSND